MKAIYKTIREMHPNRPTSAIKAFALAKDMHRFNVDQEYSQLLKELNIKTK